MAKKIFICAVLLFTGIIFAQEQETIPSEKFHFSYERQVENPKYIFGNAKIWIADIFDSPKNVIQIEDRESGTIVGRGTFDGWTCTFKIKLREGKAKIEFYNYYLYSQIFDVTMKPKTQENMEELSATSKKYADNFFTALNEE